MFGAAQTVICRGSAPSSGARRRTPRAASARPRPQRNSSEVGGGPAGGDVTLGVLAGHHEVVAVARRSATRPRCRCSGGARCRRRARRRRSGQPGQEHGEELVDAVDRQLGVDRRGRLARGELRRRSGGRAVSWARRRYQKRAVRSAGENVHTEAPGSVAARASASAPGAVAEVRRPDRRRSGRRAAARWRRARGCRSRRSCAPSGRRPRSARGGPSTVHPGHDGTGAVGPGRGGGVGERARSRARGAAGTARSPCAGRIRLRGACRPATGCTSSASLLSGVLTRVLTGYTLEPLVGRRAQHRLERRDVVGRRVEPLVPHVLVEHDGHAVVDRLEHRRSRAW